MKRYLQSVEEVVKALEEGVKVRDEKCNSYFQIVNGFITEFIKGDNNIINVNSSIYFIEGKDRFYTEEAEPLKFEVNRAYKTRCASKLFLDTISNDNEFIFIGRDGGLVYTVNTNRDGRVCKTNTDDFDIVGYWEEEK